MSDVAIIGCGIVGLALAQRLQARGLDCLLIDPRGPGGGASGGSGGIIADDTAFDIDVRMHVDMRALPSNARWLFRRMRENLGDAMRVRRDALAALSHDATGRWHALAHANDLDDLVVRTPLLRAYGDAGFERRARSALHGAGIDVLDSAQLREAEPGLSNRIRGGVLQHDAMLVRDPGEVCRRLFNRACARGANTLIAEATSFVREGSGYRVATTRGHAHVDQIVIAAGAWSAPLLRGWEVQIPLAAVRGYHVALRAQAHAPRYPVLCHDHGISVAPMGGGVRASGMHELSMHDRPARRAGMRMLAARTHALLPALDRDIVSEWSGWRACTPDGVPVIGRIGDERIFVATGHGDRGLVHAPATAEWMEALMLGETPSHDPAPYRPQRFAAGVLTRRRGIRAAATPRTP